MTENQTIKFRLFLLLVSTVVASMLNLYLGSIIIPFKEFFLALGGKSEHTTWNYIVFNLRIPKTITALLAGSGIAISGLLMQTLFRNPLAGPSVLGISHGASLGVAIFIFTSGFIGLSPFLEGFIGTWAMIIAAIIGSGLVLILIMSITSKVKDIVSILIIGIMVGFVTGSLISILEYISHPELVKNFLIWSFGNLSSVTWNKLMVLTPIVLLGLVFSFFLQKPLNALLLSENYAQAIGIRIKQTRYFIIIITGVLAGSITAFTGPIIFLGVAIPHLTRLFLKTSNHRYLLPGCSLCGATLLLVCDCIAQVPGGVISLPLNSITALLGAPVIIWIILKRRNE